MLTLVLVTLLLSFPVPRGKARAIRVHPARFIAIHTNAVLRRKCLPQYTSLAGSRRLWIRRHRLAHRAKRGTCAPVLPVPAWFYNSILCVHRGESSDWYYGAPGHRGGNGYEGGLQFVNSTWLANGGGRFAYHAYDASPMQQIIVAYQTWKGAGWGAWPNTSRACGLR